MPTNDNLKCPKVCFIFTVIFNKALGLSASAKMVAKADIAARYEAAAAAAAAAAEGNVGEHNMARSRDHSQEQRHSEGQQQQACDGGEGRAATNGHRAQQQLQAQVDGEDVPDLTTSNTNSVDEDYSYESESDGTDDPSSLPPPSPAAAAVVPFLTNAQIRELSVRIKNATGDERASRAIVQGLADAGVGVRVTDSLEGVEVYVDALTEEVKASRDSDERERECFLYRDKQGRLFNLVVAVSFSFRVGSITGGCFNVLLFICTYICTHNFTFVHLIFHLTAGRGKGNGTVLGGIE